MKDLIDLVSNNYGFISIVLAALFGAAVKCRRHMKNAIRSTLLGNRFHDLFGPTPADAIKALHDTIQTSTGLLEARQQIAEKYLKIGIYICDLEGKCTWTNDYLNNMFGLDSNEMRGSGWLQAVHPADRQRTNNEWQYAIKNNIAFNCEYTICNRKDCVSILVLAEAVAVLNDQDQIQCYVGYLEIMGGTHLKCSFDKEDN
jgi:PAS domain S-box-containing protein